MSLIDPAGSAAWAERPYTAALVLANGTIIQGHGVGAEGQAEGEVCFNTAISGYQEILTDPSYAGQIITFTFPHIGNVGTNPDDIETTNLAASSGVLGCVLQAGITTPSNYRARQNLDQWLRARGIVGIAGVDTRALTILIREAGMPNAVIAHHSNGVFDFDALKAKARACPSMEGAELARAVTTTQSYNWTEQRWVWDEGFAEQQNPLFHVVAVDYGIKRNILRCLASAGCRVTVVPAYATAQEILDRNPDGVFLSNGPGDPAATGEYAIPIIRDVVGSGVPLFGICLGHQLLGLALGARTIKMPHGHHGSNHPVMDYTTGKVEITSMNHGFAVDRASLPTDVEETHVSLFDGSNCGIRLRNRPVFSVQYHPEASPGPQDSHYLFKRFVGLMRTGGAAQSPANARHG
ncbi:glutamine-hydrolyzing carbamoyl-phosphate synthase small subunit [Rhodomicrobium sp. Az07]|uniref:glutamine-hydrolyzing carbamoyl-phosphate synthase small subunit n=1 Tax=Rhodomicrobium sp. Az07 TaxID=2839034 RepID=UPI001BE5B48C|nr:glutamine-hydrolyzing carbamoyl-phosphate synthase small subunit [Rhodomicrobium sp. Az07]MBT3070959.1 glutamine-hydrolyzing carbamoyl-phosphate synthase small subunit [Rhodomicrobium sp. Az07]